MTTDPLRAREKAFEEAFFSRESARLKESLQAALRAAETRAALAAISGIGDRDLLDRMLAIGMSAQSIAALALLPLIFTAWADGTLDDAEREAVLAAAREEGGMARSGPAQELLEHWLATPPTRVLWSVWRDYAGAFAQTLDPAARQALRASVIGRAERVARASGGILGLGRRVSRRERRILDALAAALEHD